MRSAVLTILQGLTFAFTLTATYGQGTSRPETRSFQLPTATEVFNLRTKCEELSQNLLSKWVREAPIEYKWAVKTSHYNPTTNRCYALLTAWVYDPPNPEVKGPSTKDRHDRLLFDGQTGEMLVQTTVEGTKRSGIIIVDSWRDWALGLGIAPNELPVDIAGKYSYEFPTALLEKAMADDRKQ